MRKASAVVCTLLLAACATQQVSQQHAAGTKRSIFAVHVIDERTTVERRFGRTRSAIAQYKSCAGVYVAPHLILTSSTALPFPDGEASFVNAGDVRVFDGDRPLTVTDVPHFDHMTGVTLVRVEETGEPLSLSLGQADGARHEVIGLTFDPRSTIGGFAESRPAEGEAKVGSLTHGYGALHYNADVAIPPGMCGAVVLDGAHRLVGIIHGREGTRAILIPASAIADALREVNR